MFEASYAPLVGGAHPTGREGPVATRAQNQEFFRLRGVEMIFAWPHYWGASAFRAFPDGNALLTKTSQHVI